MIIRMIFTDLGVSEGHKVIIVSNDYRSTSWEVLLLHRVTHSAAQPLCLDKVERENVIKLESLKGLSNC